jgi:hypothetical protein
MPYFLYRISLHRQLSLVTSFERFAEAKQAAHAMRAASGADDDGNIVKIIFAHDSAEAEQLLTARRERQPSEDD